MRGAPHRALEREHLPAARGEPGVDRLRRLALAHAPAAGQQALQRVERVGVLDRSCRRACAACAGSAPRCRPCGAARQRDALEADLEHHASGCTLRTGPNFSTVVLRMTLSTTRDLGVGQARIGLGERHQLALAVLVGVPHREGVVGVQRGAAAVAGLRVDQHRVDGVRVDLPLPPGADVLGAADAVLRVLRLDHHAFDAARARLGADLGQLRPSRPPRPAATASAAAGRARSPALRAARAARAAAPRAGRRRPLRAGRRRPAPPAVRPAAWPTASCGRCASAGRRTAPARRRSRSAPRRRARCRRAGAARPVRESAR